MLALAFPVVTRDFVWSVPKRFITRPKDESEAGDFRFLKGGRT